MATSTMDWLNSLIGTMGSGFDSQPIIFNSTSVVATTAAILGTTNWQNEIEPIMADNLNISCRS